MLALIFCAELLGHYTYGRIGLEKMNNRERTMAQIDFDQDALSEFCQANHIRRLSLFGSVLRDDFGPESDVDLLVEFEPDASVGLFDIARMERELSPLFRGRKVDLRTAGDLGRHMRDRVVASAEGIYAG